LRQDYAQFTQLGAEIIALGPDGPNAFRHYWEENDLPFIGCADIKSQVAVHFQQEVNWFKLGRMPAIFVIDSAGHIRYRHYGDSMSDIPSNEEVLQVISALAQEA
jgi:peroxiredoxin